MGLLGLIWELALQPSAEWLCRKWVRFVVRKRTWWSPGTPFPKYFEDVYQAISQSPTRPGRVLGSMSPVRNPRTLRKPVVPGQRR